MYKRQVTKTLEDLVTNEGKHYDVCVAIGPMIMMKFVCLLTKKLGIHTIVSMNPIMVDGTGMCGACRLQVGDEIKFACVDGPEFDGHLVDFDQAMKRSQMYKTEEGRALLKLQEGDTHHGGCGPVSYTHLFRKAGLCLYPGRKFAGKVIVADVGIYTSDKVKPYLWQTEKTDIYFLPRCV